MTADRKTKVNGFEVILGSEAECEAADYVVCMPWSTPAVFDDDCMALCCSCGHAVRHRPYAPKRPPKLCYPCAVDLSASLMRPN